MHRYRLTGLFLCLALAACDSQSMTWSSLTGMDEPVATPPVAAMPDAAPAPPPVVAATPAPVSGQGNQLNAGKTFLAMGKYQEAHDSFLAVTKQDPMNVHAWNGLGAADDMLGDKADALDAYEHAKTLNPNDYSVINNLGHLYIETGNVERAVKFLEPYENDPNAPDTLKQNLAIAREQAAALKSPGKTSDAKPAEENYADLGSYPTKGMAQGRLEEVKGLLHDETVMLQIVSETKIAGGIPTYTIKATGRPSQSICTIMNAQAFPCIPYGS